MHYTVRYIYRTFVAGLLAALPLAATLLIIVWAFRLLFGWLGPESMLGHLLVVLGVSVAGSEFVGYLLGIAILICAVFGLGLLIRTRMRVVLARSVNTVMQRIPLVSTVYDMVKRFVELLAQRDADGMRSMSAVWLQFGGPGNAAVLGLLSSPEPIYMNGRPYLAVIVPTAPIPVGGGLLYVPQEWVTSANIGMEALTSVYVSMGLTSPQHLGDVAQGQAGSEAKDPEGAAAAEPPAGSARPTAATGPGAPLTPGGFPPAVPPATTP